MKFAKDEVYEGSFATDRREAVVVATEDDPHYATLQFTDTGELASVNWSQLHSRGMWRKVR